MQHNSNMKKDKHKQNTEKGIAILFTVLMSASFLLVAIGISQIAYKEKVFSIEAKDSNRAFLAADTGVECGLYLASIGAFATSTIDTPYCHSLPVVVTPTSVDYTQFQFSLNFTTSCADVYVDTTAGTTGTSTQIDSYGYNIGQKGIATTPQTCLGTGAVSPNVVNRALRITF